MVAVVSALPFPRRTSINSLIFTLTRPAGDIGQHQDLFQWPGRCTPLIGQDRPQGPCTRPGAPLRPSALRLGQGESSTKTLRLFLEEGGWMLGIPTMKVCCDLVLL